MRKALIILSSISIFSFSFAQSLEERVQQLEKKVRELEQRLNKLENKQEKTGIISTSEITDVIVASPEQKLISYKVLSKKFKPAALKESLWDRNDKIILKMEFKNNLNKEINNINGKVIIYDKNGKELMSTKVNVNKALNFFSGTTIKPGETVKMNVEFVYDKNKSEDRKVKEASLNDLVVKFYPLKIEFADGTTKYIKYKR
ncbi:DUF3157 family protein [Persephonella sp.]|uniref:DUF3157 family protein n=1 Tax=Persephonella sp. TaxID=2060922 RepID=UPI0026147D9E|nr:DUF3157 family protein [Persephonella sp.]